MFYHEKDEEKLSDNFSSDSNAGIYIVLEIFNKIVEKRKTKSYQEKVKPLLGIFKATRQAGGYLLG